MKRLNEIVVRLITAEFFLHSGWGLIAPIFAIYVTDQIKGGSLEMVAFAVASYWIVKSTVQPFLANVLDTIKGEKDDLAFLVYGSYINALVPLGYFFATDIWHIFALEITRGITMACIIPAWYGIFTRHINKGWEAFTWSISSTTMGFSAGIAAAFGGLIATFLGFGSVFILVFILKFTSATLLFFARKKMLQELEKEN